MGTNLETERLSKQILERGNLPRHIAVIMDGNGRWARRRVMPRIAGHRVGRHAVRETVRTCAELKIEALTLYTFSRENWKRPSYEVRALWTFLQEVLETEFLELDQNDIRLVSTGDLMSIPKPAREALLGAQERLADNKGMVLNLALNYGGRHEIISAARRFAEAVRNGEDTVEDLTEARFAEYLFTPELPDPDLLIRTSGEMRLSNFMLWQLAYAEIYVTDTLWPDFRKPDLLRAIDAYQRRHRRFGGV